MEVTTAATSIDPASQAFPGSSLFAERDAKNTESAYAMRRARAQMARANKEEMEIQAQSEYELAFRKLAFLEPGLDEGDKEATVEWLEVAGWLVDGFRETTALFPTDPVSVLGSQHVEGRCRTCTERRLLFCSRKNSPAC